MAQAPAFHWVAAQQCNSAAECMLARLQVELGVLQPAQPAAATEAEGKGGSADSSTAPLEASALLVIPAPSSEQAALYLSQAASSPHAESLARLRAEADMQYNDRVLGSAVQQRGTPRQRWRQ
jgi:hypothetical protein